MGTESLVEFGRPMANDVSQMQASWCWCFGGMSLNADMTMLKQSSSFQTDLNRLASV